MVLKNSVDAVNNVINGTNDDDEYYIDNTRVQINENQNCGNDTIYASIDYTLGDNIENLTLINSSK